jgi:hypothetical protein
MNTSIKTNLYVRIAAMLFTLASATSGALSQEVPLRGNVHQTEIQVVNFPNMSVEGTGSGHVSHLGRFTQTFVHEVDLLTGLGTGIAQFTGAHGDTLSTEIAALGVPNHVPGVFVVMERHNIVSGTGRFEGATGSFVLVRYIGPPPSLDSEGTIEGTVITPKGK